MAQALAEHCVYTIVHSELLADAHRQGGAATFREAKPRVTRLKLWRKAQKAGVGMPVLLGDAADTNELLYWGVLTRLEVTDAGTSFTLDRLRRLPGGHTPQELVLRSTGNHIAPNFIRPYAICETPDFVPN
jgi:hypothetical protein